MTAPLPQGCLCPGLWNVFTWHRGIKVTGNIKVVINGLENRESLKDYPGGPRVNTGILKCGRGKQRCQCQNDAV